MQWTTTSDAAPLFRKDVTRLAVMVITAPLSVAMFADVAPAEATRFKDERQASSRAGGSQAATRSRVRR